MNIDRDVHNQYTKTKQQQCSNEMKRNAQLKRRNRDHLDITKDCVALGAHEERYKQWMAATAPAQNNQNQNNNPNDKHNGGKRRERAGDSEF